MSDEKAREHGGAGLVRDRGGMRLQHHVVERQEARIEVGLGGEHVERRAGDRAVLQRIEQRRLVDDRAARDIDEVAARARAFQHGRD